jgi:hypothetical protein
MLLLILIGSFLAANSSILVPTSAQLCESGIEGDKDGDGIPDKWETNGIDVNNDGLVDFHLISAGASPWHKDIFLEIDYMAGHQPASSVIPEVVRAFKNAPVCNPDKSNGIRLHVQLDQQIQHQDSITPVRPDSWKGFDDLKEVSFGTIAERSSSNKDNMLLAKRLVYHYVIFAHKFNNADNSGISRNIPAMDFIVSLGAYNVRGVPHWNGYPSEQAGTLMHELGHNLGLGHGGRDGVNCKPNYPSIMSYPLQFPRLVPDRPLDYSSENLGTLLEDNLDEAEGVRSGANRGINVVYGPFTPLISPTGVPINWNRDSDSSDAKVNSDINLLTQYRNGCDGSTPSQTLQGYNDWRNLQYVSDLPIRNIASSMIGGAEGTNSTFSSHPLNSTGDKSVTDNSSNTQNSDGIANGTSSLYYEQTPDDRTRDNIAIVLSIGNEVEAQTRGNQSISALSNETGMANEEIRNFYLEKLGIEDPSESSVMGLSGEPPLSNDTSILADVKSDNIDEAIEDLTGLLPSADSSFGGALSDDTITQPEAQLSIGSEINRAINALKQQSCTYENCEVTPKPANSTIEYG